jgi:hypothetical protein
MNYKFLPVTVKNMFLNPGKAWDLINSENISNSELRNGLLLPFIVIVSLSSFGGSILFVNSELLAVYSVMTAVKCFLTTFLSIYFTAILLRRITNYFELGSDSTISFRLVVFSLIPFLTCQVLSQLFESFLFINILAFFGLNIFWVGVEKLLNPPHSRKMPLLIATTVIMLLVYIITDLILSKVIDSAYYSMFA